MNTKAAIAAVLMGSALLASPAEAAKLASPEPAQPIAASASEFGSTLPPIGYVKFCASNPNECKPNPFLFVPVNVALTEKKWQILTRVNTGVNRMIKPASDQELYGQPELWTLPIDNKGDCEDYVLLKKQLLQKEGFPAASLRITVVLDEHGEGHAVLTLVAKDADYILDNRTSDIRRWTDTKYTFLKRQSAANPKQWVALRNDATVAQGSLSASQEN
jgi:predicted transglutaminase-like cysteine proteinase